MSSLRAIEKYISKNTEQTTATKPFDAGEKSTANMKIKKIINDMHGRAMRLTNASYRWVKGSGMGKKQSTEFECSLRNYQPEMACPEEDNFDIKIKPVKYKDIKPKTYSKQELICPRQQRIFHMSD